MKLHEGEVATVEEIQNFCRNRMAHFKIPKRIRFVEGFPITITGKLQKFRRRELELAGGAGGEKANS